MYNKQTTQLNPVADLHSKILDAPRSNFLNFHAVFGEIFKIIVPPWGILDRQLI